MPSEATSILEDGMRSNRCAVAVFVLDRWSALDRFLVIGSAGGTYYAQAGELRLEHLMNLLAVLDEDGPRAVARIVEISRTGRAPKNSSAVAALALAASVGLRMPRTTWFVSADRTGDTEARAATRALALAALSSVCRIPTDLFAFVSWVRRLRGFGRAVSKAVASWYMDSPVDRLALHGIKYEVRGGVSHADLIRLSHPRLSSDDQERFALIRWMLDGGIAAGVEKRLAQGGAEGNTTASAALRQVEGAEDLLMVNRLGAERAAERAALRKAERATQENHAAAERAKADEECERRARLLAAWDIDIDVGSGSEKPPAARRARDETAKLFGVSSRMLASAEAIIGEDTGYLSEDLQEVARESDSSGHWHDWSGQNTGVVRFPSHGHNPARTPRPPEPSLFSEDEVARAVDIIERFSLPHEVVPSHLKRERAVWNALLADMPVKAMIRNLPSMTRVGLLVPGSAEAAFVCSRLCDPVLLMKARIHPLGVLEAAMTYAHGQSRPEEVRWTPGMRHMHMHMPVRRAGSRPSWIAVPEILKALDTAFFLAFQNVAPANKRMMLGVDVSGSMSGAFIGRGWLSARDAAAAMCLVTARTEASWQAFGFTSDYEPPYQTYSSGRAHSAEPASKPSAKVFPGLTRLDLSKDMSVAQVALNTSALPMGSTDCALLMRYAREARLEVDTFLVLTDNEHNSGPETPAVALARYRAESGIAARLICVGMTATDYSIADGRDPLCMNVVGFDSAAPRLIADFAAGRL